VTAGGQRTKPAVTTPCVRRRSVPRVSARHLPRVTAGMTDVFAGARRGSRIRQFAVLLISHRARAAAASRLLVAPSTVR
jgi:hypothetical protein